ncbi:hypothetical protein ACRAWD_31305 [Caulobacter segnis]
MRILALSTFSLALLASTSALALDGGFEEDRRRGDRHPGLGASPRRSACR